MAKKTVASHANKPKVIQKESFQVLGYQFDANLQEVKEENLVKKALIRLQANKAQFQHRVGEYVYLIQLYPMKEKFDVHVDKFTQIIGYEVPNAEKIPDGATLHSVPENTYVAFTHQGLERELQQSYDFLYGKWLDENRYMSLGYDLELWDDRYKPESPDNEIDMFIAVEKY